MDEVNALVAALGSFAEMTHVYHRAMIDAGADAKEATIATNAFVAAFWHEQMEDARRKQKKQKEQQDNE